MLIYFSSVVEDNSQDSDIWKLLWRCNRGIIFTKNIKEWIIIAVLWLVLWNQLFIYVNTPANWTFKIHSHKIKLKNGILKCPEIPVS